MKTESPTAEIKRRISAGLLPRAKRFRAYAGRSTGASCEACGREILRSVIEYEVDLMDDSELLSRTLRMHEDCHILWLELSRQGPSATDPADCARRMTGRPA